jgi:hypothetical protein
MEAALLTFDVFFMVILLVAVVRRRKRHYENMGLGFFAFLEKRENSANGRAKPGV